MPRTYRYRKPYRIKKKKSILKNRFFWFSILGLIAAGVVFYLVCFFSPFQVKEIQIVGNEKAKTDDLRNLIEGKIPQKILSFPTKSIFLVDVQNIKKEILNNFPQVEKVNLKRKFLDKISVQIEERKPFAVFCQLENCFFIDKEGIVFESNVAGQGFVTLRQEGSGEEIKLAEKVFEGTLISKVLEIELQLRENFKILTEEVLMEGEEKANFKTLEGWQVYINPKGDITWQLTKLKADLDEEIPQERRGDLDYIELRFGNFASYKYKD